jgi:hypothetical protein
MSEYDMLVYVIIMFLATIFTLAFSKPREDE